MTARTVTLPEGAAMRTGGRARWNLARSISVLAGAENVTLWLPDGGTLADVALTPDLARALAAALLAAADVAEGVRDGE